MLVQHVAILDMLQHLKNCRFTTIIIIFITRNETQTLMQYVW